MSSYNKSCAEALYILKNILREEDFNRIPKEKITQLEKDSDKNHVFEFDSNLPLAKQLSKETSSLIVTIFRDYFADDSQKEILKQILLCNSRKFAIEQKTKFT